MCHETRVTKAEKLRNKANLLKILVEHISSDVDNFSEEYITHGYVAYGRHYHSKICPTRIISDLKLLRRVATELREYIEQTH